MVSPKTIDLKLSLRLFSLSSVPPLKDLKQKYRNLIKLYHPDLHPQESDYSNEMIRQLNQAYEVLKANVSHPYTGKEPLPSVLLGKTIRIGDEAVRNAVVMGCLIRMRNNQLGRYFCEQVRTVRDVLKSQSDDPLWNTSFFCNLFSLFLKTTEENIPRPLPYTWNSTRFFKNLAIANRYLDVGIRNYYYYLHKNRLRFFLNIPLSFLRDAEKAYSFLCSYIRDEAHLDWIKTRIKLTSLYQIRISGSCLLAE
jgi:hypothetical protein